MQAILAERPGWRNQFLLYRHRRFVPGAAVCDYRHNARSAPPKLVDEAEIERRLIEATRSWTDILNEARSPPRARKKD